MSDTEAKPYATHNAVGNPLWPKMVYPNGKPPGTLVNNPTEEAEVMGQAKQPEEVPANKPKSNKKADW